MHCPNIERYICFVRVPVEKAKKGVWAKKKKEIKRNVYNIVLLAFVCTW